MSAVSSAGAKWGPADAVACAAAAVVEPGSGFGSGGVIAMAGAGSATDGSATANVGVEFGSGVAAGGAAAALGAGSLARVAAVGGTITGAGSRVGARGAGATVGAGSARGALARRPKGETAAMVEPFRSGERSETSPAGVPVAGALSSAGRISKSTPRLNITPSVAEARQRRMIDERRDARA